MGLFKYFSKEKPKDETDLAAKAFDNTPPESELAIHPRPDYPKKRHNPPMREALNLEETQYFLQNLASTYSSFELKHLEDGICGVVSDQVIDDFLKNELERRNLEAKLADKPTKEWTPQDKETIREYLKHVTPLLRLEMKEMYSRPWTCAGKGIVAGFMACLGSVSTFVLYNGVEGDLTKEQTIFTVLASILLGGGMIIYQDEKSKRDFQKKWDKATIKYAKKLGAEEAEQPKQENNSKLKKILAGIALASSIGAVGTTTHYLPKTFQSGVSNGVQTDVNHLEEQRDNSDKYNKYLDMITKDILEKND